MNRLIKLTCESQNCQNPKVPRSCTEIPINVEQRHLGDVAIFYVYLCKECLEKALEDFK